MRNVCTKNWSFVDVLRIYDKLFFFFIFDFYFQRIEKKKIFREYGFRVTNSINCELISSLNFNLEIREESNEEVNKQINKIRNLITNLIKINLETLDKRTITIFKRIIPHIAFSLCRYSPSPHFDKEKMSQSLEIVSTVGAPSQWPRRNGEKGPAMENIGLERGTGQGRRHRGDPCTCRASHVWNRACPVPKHGPRLGHLRKIPEWTRSNVP